MEDIPNEKEKNSWIKPCILEYCLTLDEIRNAVDTLKRETFHFGFSFTQTSLSHWFPFPLFCWWMSIGMGRSGFRWSFRLWFFLINRLGDEFHSTRINYNNASSVSKLRRIRKNCCKLGFSSAPCNCKMIEVWRWRYGGMAIICWRCDTVVLLWIKDFSGHCAVGTGNWVTYVHIVPLYICIK